MVSTVDRKMTKTAIGQILGKRYRIVEALSDGGMSQTFLAKDTESPASTNCVIKKLTSADGSNSVEKTRRLFEKEAQALEKLGRHDQIPSLLAYFEEEGDFYLVQEFIEGHPLTYEMPIGERWSEEQAKTFLEDFLDVLDYIHSQNVIHLDIKPANIIRRQHDQKLAAIDFGAVKQVNLPPTAQHEPGKTQSTVLTCIGTKGYMPTEQAIGRPHLSSDIYALGMTTIQGLTGILPLQLREDDEGEILWRDQAEVSDRLAEVLTKMVRRFHKQRYQSAAEVVRSLQETSNPNDTSTFDNNATQNSSYNAFNQTPPTTRVAPDAPSGSFADNVGSTQFGSTDSSKGRDSFGSSQFSTADIPTARTSTTPSGKSKSQQRTPKETVKSSSKLSGKRLLIGGGLAVLFSGVCSTAGYAGHREFQRRNQQILIEDIESMRQEGQNEECIAQTLAFPERFPHLQAKATELLNACSQQIVSEAKDLVEANQLIAAVGLTNQVPKEAIAAYREVQELSEEWHLEVINRAENQYKQCVVSRNADGVETSGIQTAIAWIKDIPESSPVYSDAQQRVERWQQESAANKAILSSATQLLADDTKVREAEANVQNWNLQAAEGNIQLINENLQNARSKVNDLKVLNQPIVEGHPCRNQPEVQVILGNISEREEKMSKLNIDIARKREELIRRRENPLNVSAKLAVGEEYVSALAEGGVLRRDYTIRGQEGDRWNITMTSSDFDTRVYLIDPNGDVIARNDDGGNGYNSYIESVTLNETGDYRVRASSYNAPPNGEGDYNLIVKRFND